MKQRVILIVAGAVVVVAVAIAVNNGLLTSESSGHATYAGPSGVSRQPGLGGTPGDFPEVFAPTYPSEWKASLDEAANLIEFDAFVPGDGSEEVSEDTLTDVFVFPGDVALVLDFEPIGPAESVRQSYVEIYQAPWTEKMDPGSAFKAELEASPADGQSMSTLSNGTPVLTVEPNSESDAFRQNPAFLKFVLRGTQIQISGGDDLMALLQVAENLVTQQEKI